MRLRSAYLSLSLLLISLTALATATSPWCAWRELVKSKWNPFAQTIVTPVPGAGPVKIDPKSLAFALSLRREPPGAIDPKVVRAELDPNYIANQWAAREQFGKFLDARKTGRGKPLKAMLEENHKLAVQKPYRPGPGAVAPFLLAQAFAGKLRSARPGAPAMELAFPQAVVREIIELEIVDWNKGSSGKDGETIVDVKLSLGAVPSEECPSSRFVRSGGKPPEYHISHRYPRPETFAQVMRDMETQLTAIEAITPEAVAQDVKARTHFLTAVGEYYRLGINAHLFPAVNNSVMMGQVNELLNRYGFPPVVHKNLDYVALVTDGPTFSRYFTSFVGRYAIPVTP